MIPVYNTYRFIESTLQSICSQTYFNFELILINDNSRNGTLEILKSITDSRVRVFNNTINSGPYFSRNLGVSRAKGEYIPFVDSDDILSPFRLEGMIREFSGRPELIPV